MNPDERKSTTYFKDYAFQHLKKKTESMAIAFP